MLRLLLSIFILLLFHAFLVAQNYYSTLTPQENATIALEGFTLNDSLYLLVHQSISDTQSAIVVFSIVEDGSLIYRADLGEFSHDINSLIVEDEQFILVSKSDAAIHLRMYDQTFSLTENHSYSLPDNTGHFITRKLLSLRDRYIIIADENLFQEEEKGMIYSINKSNPEDFIMSEIVPEIERVELYDAQALTDTSFILIKMYQVGEYEGYLQFQTYDDQLQSEAQMITDLEAISLYSALFEVYQGNQLIVLRIARGQIASLDMNGNLQWQYAFDSLYQEFDYYHQDMIDLYIDSNHDIVICGWGEWTGPVSEYSDGCITKFSSDGQVLWKRSYREGINGDYIKGVLVDIQETPDGYCFLGHNSTYPVVGISNAGWVLKTNIDGCLGEAGCEDFQLVNIQEFHVQHNRLFHVIGNPVREQLVLNSVGTNTMEVALMDNAGRILHSSIVQPGSTQKFDISQYPNGLYYIYGSEDHGTQIERVVKQ